MIDYSQLPKKLEPVENVYEQEMYWSEIVKVKDFIG